MVSSSGNITSVVVINIMTTPTFIYISLKTINTTKHELTTYDGRLFHKLISIWVKSIFVQVYVTSTLKIKVLGGSLSQHTNKHTFTYWLTVYTAVFTLQPIVRLIGYGCSLMTTWQDTV